MAVKHTYFAMSVSILYSMQWYRCMSLEEPEKCWCEVLPIPVGHFTRLAIILQCYDDDYYCTSNILTGHQAFTFLKIKIKCIFLADFCLVFGTRHVLVPKLCSRKVPVLENPAFPCRKTYFTNPMLVHSTKYVLQMEINILSSFFLPDISNEAACTCRW